MQKKVLQREGTTSGRRARGCLFHRKAQEMCPPGRAGENVPGREPKAGLLGLATGQGRWREALLRPELPVTSCWDP